MTEHEHTDQVREQPYTARPALLRGPGERIHGWVCSCPQFRRDAQRHQDPWLCLSAADLRAWKRRHPEATCGERVARPLVWLERTFGQ